METKKWNEVSPNAILIADKDIIKQILVTNEFPKNKKYESMRLSSVTLLTATDIKWHKQRRKLLSSAFSTKYLDSLEPLIQSVIKSLIKKINVTLDVDSNDSNGTVINLAKLIHECTMDIVGETAFGGSFKMIENGDLPLIRKIFEERRRRSLVSSFPILKPFKPADPDLLKNRRQNSRREDLLQIMLDTQQGEEGMTDNEIYNQIIEFLFAGSDTSSFTITMLFAMLMENPTIERKLVSELDEALKDDELSHKKLKPLTYLNCPGKVTTKDLVLDDVNEFIPERWLNPDKIPKDCFIPFSAGTRNCIGNNFALMVIRLLTSTLLKMYRFEYISGQDMDVVQYLTPNFKTKRYDIRIWKR
ncbi:1428_t:CDS:10 [Diversispora eburnea]|uniref:1428_t:CDS:1 n=1 Tax=Diversispora eburnea TaxID=1213867 RepID=A0A9N8W9R7_9GLOM|nr:1428_t:CDS:10 [Diversispora eburnea]